jgi:hypothetical protein
LRFYDRFWTADEIRNAGEMVRTLHAEPTLFQVSARNAETARHAGPLSVKMTRRGETQYRFGARNVVVQPGQLLLVPASAEYSTHVDSQGADILTFYLPARMIADVLTALTAAEGSLLDQTRLYVWRAGRWQLAASHASRQRPT